MISFELIPPEKHELVFRRRLDDLLERPDCRFVHFDVAEGMNVLGITSYRYKGMVIRLNDSKDARAILSIEETPKTQWLLTQ